mgnify:CR=1 FL=1
MNVSPAFTALTLLAARTRGQLPLVLARPRSRCANTSRRSDTFVQVRPFIDVNVPFTAAAFCQRLPGRLAGDRGRARLARVGGVQLHRTGRPLRTQVLLKIASSSLFSA